MSRRVYVVQNQHRWNSGASQFEPKFDLSPAERFGKLTYLLSPTAAPFRPEPIIKELKEKLSEFGPEDHLLLVGNPVLIGLSVAIAAQFNDGAVSLLQWSGKDQRYINVNVDGIVW